MNSRSPNGVQKDSRFENSEIDVTDEHGCLIYFCSRDIDLKGASVFQAVKASTAVSPILLPLNYHSWPLVRITRLPLLRPVSLSDTPFLQSFRPTPFKPPWRATVQPVPWLIAHGSAGDVSNCTVCRCVSKRVSLSPFSAAPSAPFLAVPVSVVLNPSSSSRSSSLRLRIAAAILPRLWFLLWAIGVRIFESLVLWWPDKWSRRSVLIKALGPWMSLKGLRALELYFESQSLLSISRELDRERVLRFSFSFSIQRWTGDCSSLVFGDNRISFVSFGLVMWCV